MILLNFIIPVLACVILFIVVSVIQNKSKNPNIIRKVRFAFGIATIIFLMIFLYTSTHDIKAIISMPFIFTIFGINQLYNNIISEK